MEVAVHATDDQRTEVTEASAEKSTRSLPPTRTLVAGLLTLLIVVSLTALVLSYVLRSDGDSAGDRAQSMFSDGSAVQEERSEINSIAQEFVVELNTYGPDELDDNKKMPGYRERVSALTTPKFGADFEEGALIAEATVVQAQVSRVAEVFGVGVSTLDEDSARALVGGQFTLTYPDEEVEGGRIEAEPEPFRFEVTLVKIEGEWLVDDFVPVVSSQQGVPQAPEAPAPDDQQEEAP